MIGLGQNEVHELPAMTITASAPLNEYQRRGRALLRWWDDEMQRLAYCCLDPGETERALHYLVGDAKAVASLVRPLYTGPLPRTAPELKALQRELVVSAAAARWGMNILEHSWVQRPAGGDIEELGALWLGPDPHLLRRRIESAYDHKRGLSGLGQVDPEAEAYVEQTERSLTWDQAKPWVWGGVAFVSVIGLWWLWRNRGGRGRLRKRLGPGSATRVRF